MAENDQHLKHGKALCGNVFGRFVETFNSLVDFRLGLRGDAEGKNGEGHVTYDRENNIIRCDGCDGGGNGGGVTANEKSGLKVNKGEIDISGRKKDDTFGIHTLTVKGGDGEDGGKDYKIFSAEDVEIDVSKDLDDKIDEKVDEKLKDLKRVESLNGETGDLEIAGGHKVNVSTSGKTITISLDESKEDPGRDPNSNCDNHPGSEEGGGVIVGPAGGGGIGAGVPSGDGTGSSGVGCDC